MFYSTSCEYALRALTHLAMVTTGSPIQVKEIATEEGIPRHFLAKIMNQLTYRGIVKAFRGPGGGFILTKPATELFIHDIIDAIDGSESIRKRCVLGLDACSDLAPCPMHEMWRGCRDEFMGRVERLSLQQLADSLRAKRERNPHSGRPMPSASATKS